ncbi:MAG: hypothetical protein M3Y84_01020 [Acidobacteriota bacterium]|nr:hypothetical protein [Acidobacteriota bacterium]
MSHFNYQRSYRRNLPHIQPPGSTFFVTFRLAGSLPQNSHADAIEYHSLAAIRQSLKGYTAFEANQLLDLQGEFWEHESYDHWIRDDDEWQRIVATC